MPRFVAAPLRSSFGWLVLSFVPACTLTSAPFEPQPVAAGSTAAGAAGAANDARPPVDEGPDTSAGAGGSGAACSSTELPGCAVVPLAPSPECSADDDCESRVCDAGACAAATCFDGRRNAGEDAVDCGGPCSAPCRECQVDGDCASLVCRAGDCVEAACDDGVANQGESDVDCGGPCPPCSQQPTCDDGVLDGDEVQIDCGGTCGACAGEPCAADEACASAACEEGRCCGGTLGDCTRCARRLAVGIDCTSDGPDPINDCDAFLQCLADNPERCALRSAPECSGNPDGVCDHLSYGGNDGAGVVLADAILRAARCGS